MVLPSKLLVLQYFCLAASQRFYQNECVYTCIVLCGCMMFAAAYVYICIYMCVLAKCICMQILLHNVACLYAHTAAHYGTTSLEIGASQTPILALPRSSTCWNFLPVEETSRGT